MSRDRLPGSRDSVRSGRRLAIFCAGGLLLAAGLLRAQPIEYPLPVTGLPGGIVAGPDGAMWFTDYTGKVSRITTGGAITSFPVPGGVGQSVSITVGSDGNLWFAGSNGITRMTTSGVATTFVPPTAGSSPEAIAAGTDGALWFTELQGNKIGRVTTSGGFTEYPLPTASSNPYGIAAGSDGALWFTERANRIGRITTAGVITEFPIAGDMSYTSAITAGPDGALWFLENPGNKIGRITTAGVLTESPLPTASRYFGIAAGSDGNVWFTEFDGNRIGRITSSGTVTEFFVSTADSGPYGIAPGPDGNLWFTEFKAGKIGRVAPPPPPSPESLHTVAPCRAVDTRNPVGPLGGPALAARATRIFPVAGHCGIPADASAVAVNVAVTGATAGGNLSVFPGGLPLPIVSTINYGVNRARANNAVVGLGAGTLEIYCAQGSGTVHVIVDVSGYFR